MAWLVGIGLFFVLGLLVASWRAPLYVAGFWLALIGLWFGWHVVTGNYDAGDEDGAGGLDVDVVSGRGLLMLTTVVVGLTVTASSLGAVTAGLLRRRARRKLNSSR